MLSTDKHWENWGKQDPYFAVVTWDKFHSQSIEDTRSEFFETGEAFVSQTLRRLERLAGRPLAKGRALDFGCGVGRLAIPLARQFSGVVGIDISDAMLAEARSNCTRQHIFNLTLEKSDDTLSKVRGKFDCVVSFLVLQHIPPDRGYTMIDQLLTRVAPGGGIVLHISVRRTLGLAKRIGYFMKNHVPFAHYFFNVLQRRPFRTPTMQMNEYDLLTVIRIFACHGLNDVSVSLDMHPTAVTAMLYGFAPQISGN